MKFCEKCGKEIMEEAVICPNCGCAVASAKATVVAEHEDKANIGLCVLAALIPLFGIIYWPLKHKETPKKAMACGVTAIIAWAIYVAFLFSMPL